MRMPKHLFYIPAETWFSLSPDEVEATVGGLKKMGLYHLPYPEITVRVGVDAIIHFKADRVHRNHHILELLTQRGWIIQNPDGWCFTNIGYGGWVEYANLSLTHPERCVKSLCMQGHEQFKDSTIMTDLYNGESDLVTDVLIVLLATRNAVKHTIEHKAAKLGIGKKDRRFTHVTTISVPKVLDENHPSLKTGGPRAPHLRRGHIRHQRHGPKFAFARDIWIEPVFVNADPDWVSTRERYNVSL